MRDGMLRCLDRLTDTLFIQMGSSYDGFVRTLLEFHQKVREYCDARGISMMEGDTSSEVLLGFGGGKNGSVNLDVTTGKIFIYYNAGSVSESTLSEFDGAMNLVTNSVRGCP